MNKETRDTVIVAGVAILIIGALLGSVFLYSGVSKPFTVVESGSMQHSDDYSELGVIDTGDMIIQRDPSKVSITTYVDGYKSGYSKFGNYGDVIIYYRLTDKQNPIIHRALFWMDWCNDHWEVPSLKDVPQGELWKCKEGDSWDHLSIGIDSYISICMTKNYSTGEKAWYTLHLTNDFATFYGHSGYITKGDHNQMIDQDNSLGLNIDGPVSKQKLKSVAGIELPWLGCIKLIVKNTNKTPIQSNSIPSLLLALVGIIAFIVAISIILDIVLKQKEAKKET